MPRWRARAGSFLSRCRERAEHAGGADADRHCCRWPVPRTRSCARTACAGTPSKILFVRAAVTCAVLQASRRMPCVADAVRLAGDYLAAPRSWISATLARADYVCGAELRGNPAAAAVRRLYLHVRDLSGGRALRQEALWGAPMGRAR